MFFIIFLKNHFLLKLFSDCCDQSGYPGSIVYLSYYDCCDKFECTGFIVYIFEPRFLSNGSLVIAQVYPFVVRPSEYATV